jgi:8-oxo-dGTP diphosphatase
MAQPTSPKHSVSVVAAVVNDAGEVLAIRRADNGNWAPPGGVLELEETILEGLVREVLEETGVTTAPVRLTGAYKNMARKVIELVFYCRVVDGSPRPTQEAVEVRWLRPDEILQWMNEALGTRVLDALTDGPPVIRVHDGTVLVSERGSG